MKSDEELINEINERIKETDQPGSSLGCSVYALYWDGDNFSIMYYPEGNCMLISKKDSDKIIRDIYSEDQARKVMNKYIK